MSPEQQKPAAFFFLQHLSQIAAASSTFRATRSSVNIDGGFSHPKKLLGAKFSLPLRLKPTFLLRGRDAQHFWGLAFRQAFF
jgi:hypothetical protein